MSKTIGRFGKRKGIHRKPKRTCKFCNEEFYVWQDRKFCSSICYWKSLKGKKAIKKISEEEKLRRKESMKGELNPMWKGGDSDSDRRNSDYKTWRIKVFERDDFTCQVCGYFNGCGVKRRDLNAHHIIPWIDSLELRYEIYNGITLCVQCHIKEHTNKN